MAFPTNPTNGQTASVNGIVYTYDSSLTAWTVTSTFNGNVTVNQINANSIVSAGAIGGTTLTLSNQIISSVSTGTAPFSIQSTTKVANLNVEQVDGYHADTANTVSTIVVRDSAGNVTASNFIGSIRPIAGNTSNAPLQLTSGTNLTTAVGGAFEYDGTALYGTENSTTGRGEIGVYQQYFYSSAGSALGAAIADYFPTTSSLNLEANSIYDIEAVAYFIKTTAGTVIWTWAFSSAITTGRSYYDGTAIAGFTTAAVTTAPVTGQVYQNATLTLPHAATGSLTTGVYHTYRFKVFIRTNAATNMRLRVTSSAGTVTPQAGSYYQVRKISSNAGNFAA